MPGESWDEISDKIKLIQRKHFAELDVFVQKRKSTTYTIQCRDMGVYGDEITIGDVHDAAFENKALDES